MSKTNLSGTDQMKKWLNGDTNEKKNKSETWMPSPKKVKRTHEEILKEVTEKNKIENLQKKIREKDFLIKSMEIKAEADKKENEAILKSFERKIEINENLISTYGKLDLEMRIALNHQIKNSKK